MDSINLGTERYQNSIQQRLPEVTLNMMQLYGTILMLMDPELN